MLNPKSKIQNRKSFAALRRFVQNRSPREQCEVCSRDLERDHPHLFEPSSRQLICACSACLVSVGDRAGTPYRRIPHLVRVLPNFQLSDQQWDSLLIPVGMAFFFYNTPAEKMLAFYPSPAGATESLLALETWAKIEQANPALKTMEPDVEALLVNRVQEPAQYYLTPIDRCYQLVGLIRTHWRGLSGGTEVWQEIERFFAGLKRQAGPSGENSHA